MLLDASIFSRAIIGGYDIKKYQIKEETEVVIGRLTGLYGDILKYSKAKIVKAPTTFEDGKILREVNGGDIYKIFEVPAGITFERLITKLEEIGYYPALFPLYLKGTVGGFIALNGSGFGSYKFGFVKNIKTVYELIDNKIARIMAVKYSELLESDQESKFAWSSIIYNDNTIKYYIPTAYRKLLGNDLKSVSTSDIIRDISKRVDNVFKRDYVPIVLRSEYNKKIDFNLDIDVGYVINYNSPKKYKVFIGKIEESRLPELFEYLRENKDVLPFPYLLDYQDYHEAIINNFKKYEIKQKDKRIDKNIYIEASKCINCSLCLDNCLSYNVTNNIMFSPLGRFNRLLTGETNFEFCFGCTSCQEDCPVQIPISNIMEALPQYNETKEKIKIEVMDVTSLVYELEKALNDKYKNRPLFLLFVGCAAKYDPLGLEGFLNYLLINGDKLPEGLSPRVKIVANNCCGFDDYLGGNLEGAKASVEKIDRIRLEQNAVGVYFLCPEGLYVYNKFSKNKGVFGFDVIKNELKDKEIHLGCWAKKMGYTSKYKDCAGLFLASYKDSPIRVNGKDYLTVCPFSTWKFGSNSVYSLFLGAKVDVKGTKSINENMVFDLLIASVKSALDKAVDEIAEKVSMWKLGGEQYFIILSIPVLSKYISAELIRNLVSNKQIKDYFYDLIQNKLLLDQKISTYVDYLSNYNFENDINELSNKILNSARLDYSAADIPRSREFKEALKKSLKRCISTALLYNVINSVVYL
ncbi:MAG: 4Fe-4S dicluster domain-containing protein [Saccharolobus sp.]